MRPRVSMMYSHFAAVRDGNRTAIPDDCLPKNVSSTAVSRAFNRIFRRRGAREIIARVDLQSVWLRNHTFVRLAIGPMEKRICEAGSRISSP